MNDKTEKTCQQHLAAFFEKFPNAPLQVEVGRILKSLRDLRVPMPGKPGGWVGGMVYAVSSIGAGMPGVLNSELEKAFDVSMATIYKRAAMIREMVPIEFNSPKKDSGRECERGKNLFNQRAIKGMQEFSKYVAIVIRNAMEAFHCQHLSDTQMKELNLIIRNAVYTAMYAYESSEKSEMSKRFMEYHLLSIPKYWEPPELLKGFKESKGKLSGSPPAPDQ